MDPFVLIYGLVFFGLILVAHILIWRQKAPRSAALILVVMFLVLPPVAFLATIVLNLPIPGLGYMGAAQALIVHLSLSLVYISSYPAVRAVSPSLQLLLLIESAEGNSLTAEGIMQLYSSANVVTERIDDLVAYNLITEREGRFELRLFAKIVVYSFIFYRKLLGLPAGKG